MLLFRPTPQVMSHGLFTQAGNLIPSKLAWNPSKPDLAWQWEALPPIWIKPEQRRRVGFRFKSQRWILSVQKQHRPPWRTRCSWAFIYHKLLGLEFHFSPESGGKCIFRLSWEAAVKCRGGAHALGPTDTHTDTDSFRAAA